MAIPTMLKVGDEVIWRGGWGDFPNRPAEVDGIELMETSYQKEDGEAVSEVPWQDVIDRKVYIVVSLTNGCWARGNQIYPKEV